MNSLTGYIRRFRITVKHNSGQISTDISDYIISWSYNDYLTKNIDYITLSVSDEGQRMINDNFPKIGDIIKVWISCNYWYQNKNKEIKRYFGAFAIDNISANYPPSTVQIRARSLPLTSTSSREIKNKPWEKTSLKTIAQYIATQCNLELKFEGEDFKYDRIQQTNQTDLEFLYKLTTEQQKSMKITSKENSNKNILWIQDEEVLEKQKPILIITPESELLNRSLNVDFTTIFKSAEVVSQNSKKKGVIRSTATSSEDVKGVERKLVVKKRISDRASAEKMAKNALKEKNKRKWIANLTLSLGNPLTSAGVVYQLKDFGKFSRNYLVEEVVHSGTNSGYTTTVNMRGIEQIKSEVKTTVIVPPQKVRAKKGGRRRGRMKRK